MMKETTLNASLNIIRKGSIIDLTRKVQCSFSKQFIMCGTGNTLNHKENILHRNSYAKMSWKFRN